MREVLREGRSEARVSLAEAAVPGAIGVGALAGLAGEVTVVDGRVLVAVPEGAEGIEVREAEEGESAALLFLARVERWEESPLPECESYEELEDAIATALVARGIDPAAAVPVRVRGIAEEYALHVVAGACPVARPEGPPPRRREGRNARVEMGGVLRGGRGRDDHAPRTAQPLPPRRVRRHGSPRRGTAWECRAAPPCGWSPESGRTLGFFKEGKCRLAGRRRGYARRSGG
jgi:hypothetical protein